MGKHHRTSSDSQRELVRAWGLANWSQRLEGWLQGHKPSLQELARDLSRKLAEKWPEFGYVEHAMPKVDDIPDGLGDLHAPCPLAFWQALEELEVWLGPGALLTEDQQESDQLRGKVSNRCYGAFTKKPKDFYWDREKNPPKIARLRFPPKAYLQRSARVAVRRHEKGGDGFCEFARHFMLIERWRCNDQSACDAIVEDLWRQTWRFGRYLARCRGLPEESGDGAFIQAVEEIELGVSPGTRYTSPSSEKEGRYRGEVSLRPYLGIRRPLRFVDSEAFTGLVKKIIAKRVLRNHPLLGLAKDPEVADPRETILARLVKFETNKSLRMLLVKQRDCLFEDLYFTEELIGRNNKTGKLNRQGQALNCIADWVNYLITLFQDRDSTLDRPERESLTFERIEAWVFRENSSEEIPWITPVHVFVRQRLGVSKTNYDQILARLRRDLKRTFPLMAPSSVYFLKAYAWRHKGHGGDPNASPDEGNSHE